MIEELPYKFEKRGFQYRRLVNAEHGYLFVVTDGNKTFYEVFKVRIARRLLDFNNRLYSNMYLKHKFPASEDFGKWAWTYSRLDDALAKLEDLRQMIEKKYRANELHCKSGDS